MNEESIRVAVRIRPTKINDEMDSYTQYVPNAQVRLSDGNEFTFDYVYDATVKQSLIYESAIDPFLERTLEGYNGTVLAYGQTGSGKTFTMGTAFKASDSDSNGIIPRTIQNLFNRIHGTQFRVEAQFLEIFQERIIDLLDVDGKSKTYTITKDKSDSVSVTGVTTKSLNNIDDAMRCLQHGSLARTTASTKMNDQSSRSHAVFTILIRRRTEGLGILTSKFNFVDLAGSEKFDETNRERQQEGISINKALHQLSNVILAIIKKEPHIPYKNSTLTKMLQDSLGGNSATLFIACVSPSQHDRVETLKTLKFVNQLKAIKNHVSKNNAGSSTLLQENSALREEVSTLRAEIAIHLADKERMQKEIVLLRGGNCEIRQQNEDRLENVSFENFAAVDSIDVDGAVGEVRDVSQIVPVDAVDSIDLDGAVGEVREVNDRKRKVVDETYDVERILRHCYDEERECTVYRVKFENYGNIHNEWLSENQFLRGNIILKEYKKKCLKRKRRFVE